MINEQIDIIRASEEAPVLVDFWAPWCGPCQFVGPVLEELHREAEGKWKLVKVNTDEQPELMQKYGVRGIPALKLFSKGRIISEKVGALPKHELKKWLDEVLPSPEKVAWSELLNGWNDKNPPELLALLEDFLVKFPEHADARMKHLAIKLFSDPSAYYESLEAEKKRNFSSEFLQELSSVASLLINRFDRGTPVDDTLNQAAEELKSLNWDHALDLLVGSLLRDKEAYGEAARKICVAMFHTLGEGHVITQKYRKRFNMYLY